MNTLATRKVKRKKLNIKAFIILLFILYLIGMLFYMILSRPIKNIYIKNTNLLTDNEIIEAAGIKDYPPIFKLSEKKLQEKILSLDLVSNAKVTKKLNGKLIIEVEEAIPLFYNRNNEKVMLSNGKEVDANSKYLGIPTLINYVPNDLLKSFINAFSNINIDIIHMINEIEYDPDISNNVTIDEERFLLRMNDTNYVYVNILNMRRLNNYKEVIMTIGEKRGTLYLDSYNGGDDLVGLFTEFDGTKTSITSDNKTSGDEENDREN